MPLVRRRKHHTSDQLLRVGGREETWALKLLAVGAERRPWVKADRARLEVTNATYCI